MREGDKVGLSWRGSRSLSESPHRRIVAREKNQEDVRRVQTLKRQTVHMEKRLQ